MLICSFSFAPVSSDPPKGSFGPAFLPDCYNANMLNMFLGLAAVEFMTALAIGVLLLVLWSSD